VLLEEFLMVGREAFERAFDPIEPACAVTIHCL
jgi:hypothetical protein